MSRVRLLIPAAALAAGLAALLIGLELGGGAAPIPAGDPGPLVRWGYPISRFFQDAGLAVAIGGLVLACFSLKPGSDSWNRVADMAAAGSGVATVASAFCAWLSFRTLVTQDLSVETQFTDAFLMFFTQIEAGQVMLLLVISLALLTTLLISVRGHVGLAFAIVLFVVPLGAMSAAGHAGGTEWHTLAVTGMFIHILFACVWVGGLAVLTMLRFTDKPGFTAVIERYSTLALFSFFAVAFSGIVSALVRAGIDGLFTTSYGWLAITKAALLVVLGLFGVWQRRRMLPRAKEGQYARLPRHRADGDARDIRRIRRPRAHRDPCARDSCNRLRRPCAHPHRPRPAPRLRTRAARDRMALRPAVGDGLGAMLVFYLWGVWRLHRRGDKWPVHRTVLWVLGTLVFFWLTSGALNVYQFYFFSWHMLQHMMLGMLVPVLLAPGAPITLAMRTIRVRKDGSRGAREWLLDTVHSKYMAVVSSPIVASAIFVLSMWIFYYTPMIEWAMINHLGHIWMVLHFTAAGYLWVSMLLGVDPQPKQTPFALRILLMLITMAFHAFFGLSIMVNQTLIAPEYFGALGNGVDAIADQTTWRRHRLVGGRDPHTHPRGRAGSAVGEVRRSRSEALRPQGGTRRRCRPQCLQSNA